MNVRFASFALGSATAALLAGCSGAGTGSTALGVTTTAAQQGIGGAINASARKMPSLTPRARRAFVRSANAPRPFMDSVAIKKSSSVIAVSDQFNSVVDIFTPSGKQIGRLGGLSSPQGLASDIKGDLYVTDMDNSRIAVYGPGFKSRPTYLIDPEQYPVGVDSFANGKYVAVTHLSATNGENGSVSIFRGSTRIAVVSDPNLSEAFFCAFDSTGNLFLDGRDAQGATTVGEIANATSGGTTYTTLTTGNTITFPGGVQVTSNGQIAIGDQGTGTGATIVYTYNPPANFALGTPVQTTAMAGSVDAITFAFTKDMHALYDADNNLSEANEFAYPSGSLISSIPVPEGKYCCVAVGVAVIPTQVP